MRKELKAFTAIELMIVVAIIMLLVGILVPVVSGMREHAKTRLAKARVSALALGLDQFRLQNGYYPAGSTATNACILYESLAGAFMEFPKDEKRASGASFILLDPWGEPWIYYERASQFAGQLTELQYKEKVKALMARNPGSFDLWSKGRDMVDDSSKVNWTIDGPETPKGYDDIGNW